MDINKFKLINDNYGHLMGDLYLKEFALILSEFIRENGGKEYRLSGDEFIIINNNIKEYDETERYIKKLVTLINEKNKNKKLPVPIVISIGAATKEIINDDLDSIMFLADKCMYIAKENKLDNYISNYCILTKELRDNFKRINQIEKKLFNAIKYDEFNLMYQPIFNSKNNKIFSLEALARWNNKEIGYVSPTEFVPLLEKNRLIEDFDMLILKKTIEELVKLKNKEIKTNINISLPTFIEKDFANIVIQICEENNFDPKRLVIEITETQISKFNDKCLKEIRKLREHGISIAIDDFSSGEASFLNIAAIPFNILKLDRDIISNYKEKKNTEVILKFLADFCEKLNIEIILEGIEDEEQVDIIKKYNITYLQGFFYSKPISIDNVF